MVDLHLPRCEKDPTGRLDRRSLITHIRNDALARWPRCSTPTLPSPDIEEEVEFEAGMKRGKVFLPVLSTEEEEEQRKQAEIAEKVK